MQLVAYGAQDIYLTGNPQITFFKVVYRRHTNFSMETIEQTINGGVVGGGSGSVTISRNGDLVHKVYVTNTAAATNGSELVSEVELEIGGQRIDRHYAEWNQIWNELSTDESKAIGLKSMIGDIGTAGTADSTGPLMTQYPLNFWFCRNPGLALPLIALQYHEVKLKFTWGAGTAQGVSSDAKVLCDYIYLDTDERRRFAQVSHEYLIEQIQKQTLGGTDSEKLNFNHPVKELIWTSQASSGYRKAQLKLNGHDRFSAQESEYFQLRQPFDYHTAIPRQNLPSAAQLTSNYVDVETETAAVAAETAAAITELNASLGTGTTLEDPATGKFYVANCDKASSETLDNSIKFNSLADNAAQTTSAADNKYCAIFLTGVADVYSAAINKIIRLNGTGLGLNNETSIIARVLAVSATGNDGQDELSANAKAVFFDRPIVSLGGTSDLVASYQNDVTISGFSILKPDGTLSSSARTSKLDKKINVYSFGLKPEEHQPSGTCNFSRIDNAKLDFSGGGTAPTSSENIYAVNYNVLRIMSGMGGLAYSN